MDNAVGGDQDVPRAVSPLRVQGADERAHSIPAPAQGASTPCLISFLRTRCFNSRPRAGGVGLYWLISDGGATFQFPPPRRGRHRPPRRPDRPAQRFNSRPRAGGVLDYVNMENDADVSIPAPAQGASRGIRCNIHLRACFNSRPRAGGVPAWGTPISCRSTFQFPPPRRGRRYGRSGMQYPAAVSIPAPAQGASTSRSLETAGVDVSIPAPAQGASTG